LFDTLISKSLSMEISSGGPRGTNNARPIACARQVSCRQHCNGRIGLKPGAMQYSSLHRVVRPCFIGGGGQGHQTKSPLGRSKTGTTIEILCAENNVTPAMVG